MPAADSSGLQAMFSDEIVHIPQNIQEECDFFNRYIKYDLIERPSAGVKSVPSTTMNKSAKNSLLNL